MLFKLQILALLHMVEFPHCLLTGHSEERTCHHSIEELTTLVVPMLLGPTKKNTVKPQLIQT